MNDQRTMLRKEEAGKKTLKAQKQADSVEYRIENNDIFILNGQYAGKTVSELFVIGPTERDYIVKKIWFSGDADVIKIINSLVCR